MAKTQDQTSQQPPELLAPVPQGVQQEPPPLLHEDDLHLRQAQDAFNELRAYSTQALTQYEKQNDANQHEITTLRDKLAQLSTQLEADRDAHEQAREQRVAEISKATQKHETLLYERAKLMAQHGALTQELEGKRAEVGQLRESQQTLTERLSLVNSEFEHATKEFVQQRKQDRDWLDHAEGTWLAKVSDLKKAAATFRDAYQEHSDMVQQRDITVASLKVSLDERGHEMQRLQQNAQESIRLARGEADKLLDIRLEAINDMLQKQASMTHRLLDRFEVQVTQTYDIGLLTWLKTRPAHIKGAIGIALTTVVLLVVMIVMATRPSVPIKAETPQQPKMATDTEAQYQPKHLPDEVLAPTDVTQKRVAEKELPAPLRAIDADVATQVPQQQPEVAPDAMVLKKMKEAVEPTLGAQSTPAQLENQRKKIRKKMFKAIGQKRWSDTVVHGLTLRNKYRLDWESHYRLAFALQRTKRFKEASETYGSFLKEYPTNKLVDEGRFRMGSLLLKLGKKREATKHFELLAKKKKSPFQGKAKSMLRK